MNSCSPRLGKLMDVAVSAVAPSPWAKALLVLTSRRWRSPDYGVGGSCHLGGIVGRLHRLGWWIRVMNARNYVIWRNGKLLEQSAFAVVVLPARESSYTPEEWVHLCLFEVMRRLHCLSFHAPGNGQGQPPEDVDAIAFSQVKQLFEDEGLSGPRSVGDLEEAVQRSLFAGYAPDIIY